MKVKSNAKINLGLSIVGLDEKNYHLLDATMLPISLYDEIDISIADKDEVIFINQEVPENNTVTKAISLLRYRYNFKECFKVIINKKIPSGAGLGGGSSNAAFVMKAIIELLQIKVNYDELNDLALKVGADVPFFLINKPCRMQGIGEILTPFEINQKLSFLLVKPKFGINTISCYKKYDELQIKSKNKIIEIINSLKEGKIDSDISNDLLLSAKELEPQINLLIDEINSYNPQLLTMSGSGSTFVIFDQIDRLELIKNQLKIKDVELCEIFDVI